MLKFAANLSFMFTEWPFLERFAVAAKCGFSGIEFRFPYDESPLILWQKLVENDLTQVAFNMPAGNWDQGERGIACLPDRVEEFKKSVDIAIHFATILNCKMVNCLSGILPKNSSPDLARDVLISNLEFAAPKMKDAGLSLLIEPINTHDFPGFFINRSNQALEIIRSVNMDNIFLCIDIYHLQMMQEELALCIQSNFDLIKHVQVADAPGRHEPGTGKINFKHLLNLIDKKDYEGWIGCEYSPVLKTVNGIDWMKPYL